MSNMLFVFHHAGTVTKVVVLQQLSTQCLGFRCRLLGGLPSSRAWAPPAPPRSPPLGSGHQQKVLKTPRRHKLNRCPRKSQRCGGLTAAAAAATASVAFVWKWRTAIKSHTRSACRLSGGAAHVEDLHGRRKWKVE